MSFLLFPMYFRSLYIFLKFLNRKKNQKEGTVHGPQLAHVLTLSVWPSRRNDRSAHAQGARRSAVTTSWSRSRWRACRWHDGYRNQSRSPRAIWRQLGDSAGQTRGGRAYRGDTMMWRWWSSPVATVFPNVGGAAMVLVSDDVVLEHRGGKMSESAPKKKGERG
jgi:hypothetical protein